MSIHSFLDYIHSSKKGVVVSTLRGILYGLSLPYRFVTSVRNALYDNCYYFGRGIRIKFFKISIYNFKARIISIGNIVAGGTGKTPLTILIAKEILKRGKSLAILSRGYKSKMKKDTFGPELVCEGNGPTRSAKECGDEPYLISKNVPNALFYVGKNRVEASRMATKKRVKYLLLDDGMQYRTLHRDYEIVIIDAQDPFGKNYFLPRGFLREHPKALKRADLIVINHADNLEHIKEIESEIKKWSDALTVGVRPVYVKTLSLDEKETFSLKDKKVAAFCGIAKPNYFYKLLEKEGAEVVTRAALGDHKKANAAFLEEFAEKAVQEKADLILCTEKDAVKLTSSEQIRAKIPLGYVKMELEVFYGKENFEQALNDIT